ncbi:lipopolysaccharide biosynthesis protein [Gramella sp. KN1008]|uniref:lipopolysaccharide biosynthesis protein n=1 Tax=Gramella sp. KN1008 TaxID=2529298 RepID=UPI0010398292|nr:lipopolysaccharide biosynthesis protein [Gramella sp. KN1008]TBW26621.1 lipopolysaccharide biosynthesis protein [Gramella sp. KN1008]
MSLKKKAATSLVWTFTQQFGNQVIGFVVSLVLARILLPEEFGLIGMIAVVVSVGGALLEGGTTNSLIRDTDCNQTDYATIFFFQVSASVVIYGIIYLLAPLVSSFYKEPLLTSILRIYSISLIINALSSVQFARLTKVMNFKTQTIIAIPSAIIGGIIGVWMAMNGYGVWSLVWSNLFLSLANTAQIWIYSKWFPIFKFDPKKLGKHLNFGYKLILSDLLNRIFNNIFLIAIGKSFSAAQVGFYTRAETMNQLPVKNISKALGKVTFPLFVKIQRDDKRLRVVYSKLMKMVIFIIAPVLIFLAFLAEPIFRFLFTEKWLPAVPYFQVLCVTGIMFPLHSYNLDVLNVKGRSDLFLKLEIVKKILILITLLVTLPFGIMALLYGQVFVSLMAFFINAHYTGKYIDYTALQQLRDVIPIILLAAISGLVILLEDRFILGNLIDLYRIVIGGVSGVLFYLLSAKLLKLKSYNELINIIKDR